MSFNNGNERRKLNAKWEQLRVQYREAGMSEEAIQAMYEFDLGVLNSERAYDANTVAVCDGEDDVDAKLEIPTRRHLLHPFRGEHRLGTVR